MIETTNLVDKIEEDLNRLLRDAAPDGQLAFKIWANVGEHTPPERDGNKVRYLIEGNMRGNASSMEANIVLAIGVNSFSVDFMIPLRVPHTAIGQEIAELQTIQNGQYVFPAFIIGILSQYFQSSKSWKIRDNQGVEFAVGVMGGVALPGDVDIKAFSGESLPVSVHLTANIVMGGTVSTDVLVRFNNRILPAQVTTPSRTAVINNDVLNESLESKSVATSSASHCKYSFRQTLMRVPTK